MFCKIKKRNELILMEGFELYKKVANLMLEVNDSYGKVASYLRKSINLYPTADYDVDYENSKLESTGLALYVHHLSISLYPVRYRDMLKSWYIADEKSLKNPYRLFPIYDSLFQKSIKGYPISKESYVNFWNQSGIYYSKDPIELLETAYEELTIANEVFKEDYQILKANEHLFKEYQELFDVNPTGDYKGLKELLDSKGITLNRLLIVDGEIKLFSHIYLEHLTVVRHHNDFVFYPTENVSIEPYNEDNKVDLGTLTNDLNTLLELKDDVEIATEIVEVIKTIKNVNYFQKD